MELSRRDFMKALGATVGTIAVAAAVPAWAEEILPGGLTVAKALPINKSQLKYEGAGVVRSFEVSMSREVGSYANTAQFGGPVEWRVEIQGIGPIFHDPSNPNGMAINLADGQRWLVRTGA